MPGLEGEAFADSSTARTEVPEDDDEFKIDVEADLGDVVANGVVVGDILSSADVDSEVITSTKSEPEEVCPLALESDTALLRDLLLAEDSTDAKAEELVFCCDRIMFCGAGGAAGVDGGVASSVARDNVGD